MIPSVRRGAAVFISFARILPHFQVYEKQNLLPFLRWPEGLLFRLCGNPVVRNDGPVPLIQLLPIRHTRKKQRDTVEMPTLFLYTE